MEQNQNPQQLNGYKFSFNRVNPYLSEASESNQTNNQRPQNKVPQKQSNLISSSSNPIYKNTKQIFYKRQNESEKNKMLVDLYLRKTKFSKMKQGDKRANVMKKPLKMTNSSFGKKISNTQKGKPNQVNLSDLHIKVSHLTETKQENYEHEYSCDEGSQRVESELLLNSHIKQSGHLTGITSPKSKISSSLRIQQANQQFPEESHNQQNEPIAKKQPNTTKRKSEKRSIYKIYRNLSENKFNPYLSSSSPKNNSRIKNQKSGTTPIYKASKVKKSISLLKLNPATTQINTNSMLTIQTSTQQKSAKKAITQLRIKPEKPHDLNQIHTNFYKLTSPRQNLTPSNKLEPLKLQNLKSANQQLTNKKNFGLMGHIKYKSPRMILSSRNQLFKSRNQPPKIKLFTQEEESNIIQEFYSQDKQHKKKS